MVTELEWDVREYHFLLKECQWAVETVADVDLTITSLQGQDSQRTQSKLAEIRCRIESLVRGIVRKQRQAASHAMVFMVSPETRRRKPYALPVQLLPYRGLKDSMMRHLTNKLKMEMKSRNMEVVGMSK